MSWYILLVHPGFEQSVRDQLVSKQKLLSFDEIQISDDLSSYVFVRSNEINEQQVRSFLSIEGTLKFLGTKKSPQKFTTSQIKKLSFANTDLKTTKQPTFKVGDHVVIKNGDLADIDGEIVELKKRIVKIKPMFFSKVIKTRVDDIGFL